MTTPDAVTVTPVPWPEVQPGDDLAELVLESTEVRDGDVLVLTSKVVSKSEGRQVVADRASVVEAEAVRVVARRGRLVIAETRHGLVLAAAGVDSSNTAPGTALALPVDPDATARRLRLEIARRAGRNVAVVVTDTAGRAWRVGQTDLAIGCAGLDPVVSLLGTVDSHGNELLVTAPALADELAAAGDLAKGKVSGCPLAVVRGLGTRVLPAGENGPGAAALVRTGADDLFGLGARDAVVAATARDDATALASFAALGPEDDPFERLQATGEVDLSITATGPEAGRRAWTVEVAVPTDASPATWLSAGRIAERVRTLAAAHRLTEASPAEVPPAVAAVASVTGTATVVDRTHWVTS